MDFLNDVNPKSVFKYFAEICEIPHGSGNMNGIFDYCKRFAKENNLKAVGDDAKNIVIYKNATCGYENHEPVILQGHLDMVCQKTEGTETDFEKDGIVIYKDGDFIKAKGTTLGADNGIAVAMIFSVLADKSLSHPPIEAVLTTDEEIGMIGAGKLDFSLLSARRMINLDSEEEDVLTVSCAGGSDFKITIPIKRQEAFGEKITISFRGLLGGHSGVEINEGRINGGILAGRFLCMLLQKAEFSLVSLNGGDKGNAIIPYADLEILGEDSKKLISAAEECLKIIKTEIAEREPGFEYTITKDEKNKHSIFLKESFESVLNMLLSVPNGVLDMSRNVEGLVETSLNLGILKTFDTEVEALYTLRSNKQSALDYLEKRLLSISRFNKWQAQTSGHYPPWEFLNESGLQKLYIDTYNDVFGTKPKVMAIHAGLECGVFSSKLKGLDCIAIGPDIYDVHTANEKLSIPSVGKMYGLLIKLLEKM